MRNVWFCNVFFCVYILWNKPFRNTFRRKYELQNRVVRNCATDPRYSCEMPCFTTHFLRLPSNRNHFKSSQILYKSKNASYIPQSSNTLFLNIYKIKMATKIKPQNETLALRWR